MGSLFDDMMEKNANKMCGEEKCRHNSCKECHGTGTKKDGTTCLHIISCKCKKCNVY